MTFLELEEPEAEHRVFRTWVRHNRQRLAGVGVGALGVGLLVWAGVLTTSKPGPSTPELIVILTGASILQIAGAAVYGRVGHADPNHARSAVRRLITIGLSVRSIAGAADDAIEADEPRAYRDAAIRASEALGAIGVHLTDAISDWSDIHEQVLAEIVRAAQRTESLRRDENTP